MQNSEELWLALGRTVIAHTEGQAVDTGQPGTRKLEEGFQEKPWVGTSTTTLYFLRVVTGNIIGSHLHTSDTSALSVWDFFWRSLALRFPLHFPSLSIRRGGGGWKHYAEVEGISRFTDSCYIFHLQKASMEDKDPHAYFKVENDDVLANLSELFNIEHMIRLSVNFG